MKIQPENIDDIVAIVASKFPSFGGGNDRQKSWNPIAAALENEPPQFAAGVDIKSVVKEIISQYEMIPKSYHAAK